MRWRLRSTGWGLLLLLGVAVPVLVASPAGATLMLELLEAQSFTAQPSQLRERNVQAIAVVSGRAERVETAAELHLATGLPLVLLGREVGDEPQVLPSRSMLEVLHARYRIEPTYMEAQSKDTRENAILARCLLAGSGIHRLALVTDGFHIPRALRHFEAAGFEVLPAPATDWKPARLPVTFDSFLPGITGWRLAKKPVKEWAGIALAPMERLFERAPECNALARQQPPASH
jgi:uncharacterized SAM-binding protein YcdF (DUF218 family)